MTNVSTVAGPRHHLGMPKRIYTSALPRMQLRLKSIPSTLPAFIPFPVHAYSVRKMLDHVTPFFALFASILVLLPLSWHIRSRNVGTITLSLYLFFGNFDNFVNSTVWWSSTANKAPGFCEISKYATQGRRLLGHRH